ncbi:MAG TPA: hypothetical protein VMX36_06975 [Sedimentisphaerales bacterium]|nr:hypothetical protein [Sedimentisphaerales bacterium]
MWFLRDLSRLFSVLLIIAIGWSAAVNSGFVRNADKSSCSGNEGDIKFRLEVAANAIIAPNNGPDRQTGIHLRKISLVYGFTSGKAFGQGLVLSALSNRVSLSALITKFKSPSLFALHSCLTV